MRHLTLPWLLVVALPLFGHGGIDHSQPTAPPVAAEKTSPPDSPALAGSALPEQPHAAPGLTTTDIWNRATAISLIVLGILYAIGSTRLRRADAGRLTLPGWRVGAFATGLVATAIALLGPLDRWSEILFSAHMAQHEILMLIAAPLMVAGKPFIATLWAIPRTARGRLGDLMHHPVPATLWDRLTGPFTVLIIHAAVLWGWHIPVMYEAALRNETVHVIQHLGFFFSAALFWWALIHGRYGRLGYGVGVLYVFATAMHTQILGALLTFGSRIWYPTHAERTAAAGLQAVEDQQLAGIVMWIPFGVIFVFIGLALFAAWLGEAERRVAFSTAGKIRRGEQT